jgi:PAS domain S-box-containing protein
MYRENYRILSIYEVDNQRESINKRLIKDFPKATITHVNNFQDFLNKIENFEYDIAILFCNISWLDYKKCISFLNSVTPKIPMFTFLDKNQFDDVTDLLNMGVRDYSMSDPVHSYRLPVSIRSIVSRQRELVKASRIEQELHKQTILFKTLFDYAPEAIALTNADGLIININKKFTEMFGYSLEESKDCSIDDLLCTEKQKEEARNINQSVLSGENITRQLIRHHKDGHEINVSLASTPIIFISGTRGLYAIYRNIDSEVKTTNELMRTRLYLNSVLESIDYMILALDVNGSVSYFNTAYHDHLLKEYDFDMKIGSNFFTEDVSGKLEQFRKFILGAYQGKSEKRIVSYGKENKTYRELSYYPIYSQSKLVGITYISRDITSYIETQMKLEDAVEKAKAADIAKSQFLATMSHEIRTPLNGIIGMTSLMKDTELTVEQLDYIDSIKISGNTLMDVINDVLDFSKLQSTEFHLEPTVFSLDKLIHEIETIVYSRAKQKSLYLNFNISAECYKYFMADKLRIKQILLNIIYNAIKFTDEGGITVSMERIDNSSKYMFIVTDTGCGISEVDQIKLFDPFTQTKNTLTKQVGGTGLGLTIVKRLTAAMSGSVELVSEVGKGSSFKVIIELNEASQVEQQYYFKELKLSEIKLTPTFALENPLRILVAEDNKINQKLILKLLEKIGYQADMVVNGKEAFEKCKVTTYDLVLMDVEMPVMGGIQSMNLIKSNIESAPYIIAVTANATSEDEQKYLDLGMDDYISKPIELSTLLNRIHKTYLKKTKQLL